MQKIENGLAREMTRSEVLAWYSEQIRPQWSSVEEARIDLSSKIDQQANARRAEVVSGIHPAEMASWPIKREQAILFRATGQDSSAPMLLLEAQSRSVTLEELVDMVLAKADLLSVAEATIAGEAGALQDRLRAAETMADIESLAGEHGWLNPQVEMPELPPEDPVFEEDIVPSAAPDTHEEHHP